eukprot:Awhi_evm1s9838
MKPGHHKTSPYPSEMPPNQDESFSTKKRYNFASRGLGNATNKETFYNDESFAHNHKVAGQSNSALAENQRTNFFERYYRNDYAISRKSEAVYANHDEESYSNVSVKKKDAYDSVDITSSDKRNIFRQSFGRYHNAVPSDFYCDNEKKQPSHYTSILPSSTSSSACGQSYLSATATQPPKYHRGDDVADHHYQQHAPLSNTPSFVYNHNTSMKPLHISSYSSSHPPGHSSPPGSSYEHGISPNQKYIDQKVTHGHNQHFIPIPERQLSNQPTPEPTLHTETYNSQSLPTHSALKSPPANTSSYSIDNGGGLVHQRPDIEHMSIRKTQLSNTGNRAYEHFANGDHHPPSLVISSQEPSRTSTYNYDTTYSQTFTYKSEPSSSTAHNAESAQQKRAHNLPNQKPPPLPGAMEAPFSLHNARGKIPSNKPSTSSSFGSNITKRKTSTVREMGLATSSSSSAQKKLFKCVAKDCNAQLPLSQLKEHFKAHPESQVYHCEFEGCNKFFARSEYLMRHMKRHKKEKHFVCSVKDCQKSFVTVYEMKVHIKNFHENLRPWKCSYEGCDKVYTTLTALKQHVRTHTNDRPFTCEYEGCGKSYYYLRSLNYHIMSNHQKIRPFKCTHEGCTRAFVQKYELSKHLLVHKKKSLKFELQPKPSSSDKNQLK